LADFLGDARALNLGLVLLEAYAHATARAETDTAHSMTLSQLDVVAKHVVELVAQSFDIKAHSFARILACAPVAAKAGLAFSHFGNSGTLLMELVRQRMDLVKILLTCKEVLQTAAAVDNLGRTALMLAARVPNNEQLVAELLKHDEVAQHAAAADAMGRTALIYAARNNPNNARMIEALLACPAVAASAGHADSWGNTALIYAAAAGRTLAVEALMACPRVAETAAHENAVGLSALAVAVQHGWDHVLCALPGGGAIYTARMASVRVLSTCARNTENCIACLFLRCARPIQVLAAPSCGLRSCPCTGRAS